MSKSSSGIIYVIAEIATDIKRNRLYHNEANNRIYCAGGPEIGYNFTFMSSFCKNFVWYISLLSFVSGYNSITSQRLVTFCNIHHSISKLKQNLYL